MNVITKASPMASFQSHFMSRPLFQHFNHRAEPPAHEREVPEIVKYLKFSGQM